VVTVRENLASGRPDAGDAELERASREAAIQRSLDLVGRDRTVIVIAHRLSTVRHAERIHVLEAGRIVESGTHDALLEERGRYAAL
jgi:ATP-binding cassette, subfamily B, bacterial